MSNDSKRKSSRRNALRWCCNKHSVKYKTEYDEGKGDLINISSGGCFFESVTLPLSVQEKVFISIKLDEEQDTVEAKAVVVRAKEDKYAVKFILIELDTQNQIRAYFTQQLRNK